MRLFGNSGGARLPKKSKTEFSKALLVQESILVWIITISYIVLAFFCILNGMAMVEIGFLTVLPTVAWGAYGVSQAFYYKMATSDHKKDGITHDIAMAQLEGNGPDPYEPE